MKRPITLLCLADLHLVETQSSIISGLRRSIKELMFEKPMWRPDYLVIAGDLVDAKNKQYNLVKEHINSFIDDNDFHLNRSCFIAVPGNHDKDFPYLNTKCKIKKNQLYIKEKKKYQSFVSSIDSGEFDFNMKEQFKENFKSFGSFYSDYVSKSSIDAHYIYPQLYLGKELEDVALTSGLKVFDDSKTCFLSINTEWVYLPEDSKTDSRMKKICPQLVISSMEEYLRSYRDYALITVMHRSPYELSWTEKNGDASDISDVLRLIYNYSDIVLSGHDHIEKVLPPHMMENKAQLFQLGSASMANRFGNNKLVRYLATIIHMDVIEGTLRMCSFWYDYKVDKWQYQEDQKVYPLSSRLGEMALSSVSSTSNRDSSCLKVNIKGSDQNDIRKAIRGSHPGLEEAGYFILIHNINDEGLSSIINDTFKKKDKIAVFVYSFTELDHNRFSMIKERFLIDKTTREQIYQKKLIIMEVCFSLYGKQEMNASLNRNNQVPF